MTLICAFITWWGALEKRESVEVVIKNYQVIESSERVLSLLKDMESGHRGYIIVKDSMFLDTYQQAQQLLKTETGSLVELVSDNPTQTRFLKNKILPAIENRRSASINTITIVNSHGKDSARAWIESRIGKSYMDTIRVLVNHFIQNERVLLADREKELETNTMIEDVIEFSSFAVIGITCTLAFFRLQRERRSINELLDRLEDANTELEEKVKRRTQELVVANEAKDHFLGIASHDLKVPIAGVLGLIDIMRIDNHGRSDQDVEFLSYMEESCKGMQNLISNLLDINRIDRHETPFTKQRIDLFPFLSRIEKGFVSYAKKKSIPLTIEKTDAVIESDPDNLSRILDNLLSNAIKFSAPGQSVMLSTSMSDHHVVFKIIDHGPGIPEQELPILFKKFSRLTNRPTAGESTSGLGLAIVKELTEMAGGTVAVESQVGNGTTFIVKLPIG